MNLITTRYPIYRIKKDKYIEVLKKDILKGKIVHNDIPCNNCFEKKNTLIYTNDRDGFKQNTVCCSNCGFVYLNKRMNETSLNVFYKSGIYWKIYKNSTIEHDKKHQEALKFKLKPFNSNEKYHKFSFINFLFEFAHPFESVYEIGAAGGANLIPFSALGKKVSGIELSPEMVRYANKHKLNVKEGTINEIEKGFDLYIIQHVLEHVFDLSEFLTKLREKKVKHVFVGVPGFHSMVPSIQIAHNFYFSPNTLKSIFSKFGYRCNKLHVYKNNNYMMALFEHSQKSKFVYNKKKEISKIKFLVLKQKIKQLLINFKYLNFK